MNKLYDVIVVGGGHAGVEAAYASARMNINTLLITYKINQIGKMSCNPSVGGLGKGHLVREIDALGGVMGRAIDKSGIHFRLLNASKGEAVAGLRAQADRDTYINEVDTILKKQSNLNLLEDEVVDIFVENERITGVLTKNNGKINCNACILTTGTFLNGIMHCGEEQIKGGRVGDDSCESLSIVLKTHGFELKRLKTGTPCRISLKSIDLTKCETQESDELPEPFSYCHKKIEQKQFINCYITHTNLNTHEIIKDNYEKSPLFNGQIEGIGPRYCPSIEDKVIKFPHHETHHVFLEPEGLNSDIVYPNGISTSLPKDVQDKIVTSINGLERAEILEYGYAIEYDCIDSKKLKLSLEAKDINGLFFAGQINGTSGYEEAAAQGIIAGINAGLKVLNKDPFILSRTEAMLAVLIDDITLMGVDEPYRMFTARAEFRLMLRSDNADLRLTQKAIDLGIISEEQKNIFEVKTKNLNKYREIFKNIFFSLNDFKKLDINSWERKSLFDLLKSELTLKQLSVLYPDILQIDKNIIDTLKIEAKYEGYINRSLKDIEVMKKDEKLKIPSNIDYDKIQSLTNEIKQKLKLYTPENIMQAGKINGMTPSGIIALLRYIKSDKDKI